MRNAVATAARLRELARLLEARGENRFRVGAYERAAHAIEQARDLERLVEEGRLTELPGVGRSLAGVVEELVRTGTTAQLERLRAQLPSGYRELVGVPGLGPKRVLQLHDRLGVEDLDDLERACREERLRTVPGLSARLEAEILAALPSVRARLDHFLLAEALPLGERLADWLAAAPEIERVELTGAVRRCEETVTRLDLLAATETPETARDRLAAHPELAVVRRDEVLELRTAGGLPVVLRTAPVARFGAALVETTGPREHVAALRARGPLGGGDEAAVYAGLGLPLVPPELRDAPDALARPDLDALVGLADIRGYVHCHTVWSDGRHTILEMARAAEARGAEYLTITDHSAAALYAGGLDRDRLLRQWDEIDRVQEQVGITLLKGSEADILADGAIDWPHDVLERLDVVIASVHQRHRLDRRGATERLVRAMRQPVFKIWGHALGRLLLRRPPIDCDLDAVLEAAVGRAAIEINGDPRRLDLAPEHVRRARRLGLRFVVGVDAHSTDNLGFLRLGVAMARRGGLRRDEVLNTLPTDAFREAVRPTSGHATSR